MIEPRIYRAAFAPALLAVVIAMFSLQSQPPALGPDLAADVLFEGELVVETAQDLARANPDRRAGTPGDAAAAEEVAASFRQAGLETDIDEFNAQGRDLTNVIGRRTGALRDQIVVLAPRDAASTPDLGGSATDTAALLELANALEGRASRKTLVLASVDGSTLGEAGVRRFAETAPDRERIGAVLALSSIGFDDGRPPELVTWSNDDSRVSIGLQRTAAEAMRREFRDVSVGSGLASQLAHVALPLGIGAQGVLLEEGLEAVRFSGSGELPPPPESEVDADRVGALGRSVLQTLSALDEGGRPEHGPETYVTVAGSVVPGWTVSILALTLILPALIASVDAFARARRRREPVRPWTLWVGAGIAPFVIGLATAFLLVLTGRAANAPAAPQPPAAEPFDGAAAAALGVVAAVVALTWIFGRPLLARAAGATGDPAAPGAGCATALVLSLATLATWVVDPFAALALVPAAHGWMLAMMGGFPRHPGARALLVLGGLLVPAAIAFFYLSRLSLNPLEAAWYLLLLVTGGGIDILQALLGCVMLGVLASVIVIVLATRRRPVPEEERRPAVRGPGGYAGPGSLGGTKSALRR